MIQSQLSPTMFTESSTAIHAWLALRDQRAAVWLVQEHRGLLLSTARKWGAPAEMEEDAVQEVWLRAFRALSTWQPERPFLPWLCVIARNTCAKLRRRWCHRHTMSACFENAAVDIHELDCVDEGHQDAAQKAAHAEYQSALLEALQSLTERERFILEQQHLDGRPAAEVAAKLGITPGAARVILHRTLKRLDREIRHEEI